MAVHGEAMYLVSSLVLLRFGLFEVCLAGVGQRAAFSLLEKTSLGWRPSRLPPLPCGHAEGQEDEAVTGGRWTRDCTAKLSQLSFMEEVENSSVPVPRHLQGSWWKAELANSS